MQHFPQPPYMTPYQGPYHYYPHPPPQIAQAPPGPPQGPPQVPLQGPPQVPLQGPPQGPLQGPPQGPLQGPPQGPIQVPPHVPLQGPPPVSLSGPPQVPSQTPPQSMPQTAPQPLPQPPPQTPPQVASQAPSQTPHQGPQQATQQASPQASPQGPPPGALMAPGQKQDTRSFPKNSVENTKPATARKRKYTSKDLSDIEVWRLLMCLKSGLLAESSWAIDVLSILLNDDSTLMYFNLQNTPGLLEAILEHFKCCLNELFDGLVSDTNLTYQVKMSEDDTHYELILKPVDYSHWQEGKGEDVGHIQVHPDTSRRCICLSTILRNLSFIPGNDVEMSRHAGLILVLGRLLLLRQDLVGDTSSTNMSTPIDSQQNGCYAVNPLREDALVIISNISNSIDLTPFNDHINMSLLNGLLHWACSESNYALDYFPIPSSDLSPQRLALESLAKLSIIEGNVDLILATPPWSRIEKLFQVLTSLLSSNEEQPVRELSLVLLSNLTSADSGIARSVALTDSAITRLISFLETSISNPEEACTTQDMLRRAAQTLKCLSHFVDNHVLFTPHQQRLLNLVMSPKLDREVTPLIADVIFEISLSFN